MKGFQPLLTCACHETLTDPPTHSFVHPPTHSLIYPLNRPPNHPRTHSLSHPLPHPLTHPKNLCINPAGSQQSCLGSERGGGRASRYLRDTRASMGHPGGELIGRDTIIYEYWVLDLKYYWHKGTLKCATVNLIGREQEARALIGREGFR